MPNTCHRTGEVIQRLAVAALAVSLVWETDEGPWLDFAERLEELADQLERGERE